MTQLTRPEGCLTDLALDAWSSGELDAQACERAAAHLTTCERCRRRRSAMEAERAEFYAAAPSFKVHAARVASSRTARLGGARAKAIVWGGALTTLVAAAAMLLLPTAAPSTRHKGGPSLGYFVKRGERVFQGQRDSALQPGDLIRFTYSTQLPRYLALFSRDAHNTSVYYPSGPRAARVHSDKDVGLDLSVELDAALGEEQVHALFCPEVFELAPLLGALRETGRLPVPDHCQLRSITLHKVSAP